jgi:hypothetical protein
MDQNPKTKLLIEENKKPKENQEQKIPRIPIIKGLKKTVSTMHLDTVEELSLRIFTLQCIHCWIKNLIPAVDPTHTHNPKSQNPCDYGDDDVDCTADEFKQFTHNPKL